MPKFEIFDIKPGTCLADDETIRMDVYELAPGESYPVRRNPKSDEVFLLYEGEGEFITGDRVFKFQAIRHAFIPAGTAYQLRNTGSVPLRFIDGMCPGGPREENIPHDERGGPGGVTLLSIDQYDRFPDSGLVRGGMHFLETPPPAPGHSHDGATEMFIFIKGEAEISIDEVNHPVRPGQAAYVPQDVKHRLDKPAERLTTWLVVTPNIRPSHTFYEPAPGGGWKRRTPRYQGQPMAAGGR